MGDSTNLYKASAYINANGELIDHSQNLDECSAKNLSKSSVEAAPARSSTFGSILSAVSSFWDPKSEGQMSSSTLIPSRHSLSSQHHQASYQPLTQNPWLDDPNAEEDNPSAECVDTPRSLQAESSQRKFARNTSVGYDGGLLRQTVRERRKDFSDIQKKKIRAAMDAQDTSRHHYRKVDNSCSSELRHVSVQQVQECENANSCECMTDDNLLPLLEYDVGKSDIEGGRHKDALLERNSYFTRQTTPNQSMMCNESELMYQPTRNVAIRSEVVHGKPPSLSISSEGGEIVPLKSNALKQRESADNSAKHTRAKDISGVTFKCPDNGDGQSNEDDAFSHTEDDTEDGMTARWHHKPGCMFSENFDGAGETPPRSFPKKKYASPSKESKDGGMYSRAGVHSVDGVEMSQTRMKAHSVYAGSIWPTKFVKDCGHFATYGKEVEQNSDDGSEHSVYQPLGFFGILKSNPVLSSFMIFVPFGFVSHMRGWGDSISFSLNFLAIVPMAWLMGKSTEDLSCHMGQITGGLLNAWFGNVVEMLLCVAGLRRGELVVVRSTLIGSILSNLLLVTGCSFLFGGMKYKVQEFSAIGASTNASLMTLSCMCLGLPTIYATILSSATSSELQISRTVSFFLIFIYIQYLIFQLGTHSFLFADDNDETADLSLWMASVILICCSICCSFCSDFLVASIEGVVTQFSLSKEFIGIILLPIVGNAAEHYTSVIVAMRNKMDLSLACAVGSSCQMALFVTPFTVLIGWCMDQPMSLDLHAFELLVLVMSVLIITSILQDGYSHWLEGSMLVSAYCVIAIIYFFEESQYSEII